jgi:hypothetical protein
MQRGSFVPVILLAIAMVAVTGRPARSAPTTGDITLTKATDTTSPLMGSVFDWVTDEIVDVSATLHVVVKVSLDVSNPSADTCSGVTNVESTYTATGRTTKAVYRIAVNTAYPPVPCPVPGASDRAIIFDIFPVAECEGLPDCGGQIFQAILWQQITVDASGGLTYYQKMFGISTCDPFVNCPPTLLGPP